MKKLETGVTLSDFRRNFRKYVKESDLTNPLSSMSGGDAFCGKLKDNNKFILYFRKQNHGSFFTTIIRGKVAMVDDGIEINYHFSKFLFFMVVLYALAIIFFLYGVVVTAIYWPMGLLCYLMGILCLLPMVLRPKTRKKLLVTFLDEKLCKPYLRK